MIKQMEALMIPQTQTTLMTIIIQVTEKISKTQPMDQQS